MARRRALLQLTFFFTIASVLVAAAATAQFTQYRPPGSLIEQQTPLRETVKRRAEEARWKIGPVRFDPWVTAREIAYVDNVYDSPDGGERVSDFTATFGLGAEAFLKLGRKAVATGFAAVESAFWLEQEDLREVNGSYGARFFGLYNRLTVQVEGGRIERQRTLSDEARVPAIVRQDRASLAMEIDLRGPFALFGSASADRFRHGGEAGRRLPGLDLPSLDRDEQLANAGVQYTLRNGLALGLGVETAETDFIDGAPRSNSSTGPLAQLRFDGNHLNLDLRVVLRTIEFEAPAQNDRDEATGVARLGWRPGTRHEFVLFASRDLVYSAFDRDDLFESSAAGVSLTRHLGNRSRLELFGQSGSDRFSSIEGSFTGREDELASVGLRLTWKAADRLRLRWGAVVSERDSNFDVFDREYVSILVALDLGGDLLAW